MKQLRDMTEGELGETMREAATQAAYKLGDGETSITTNSSSSKC